MVGFICIKISFAWVSAIFYNILYWVGNIITAFLFLMYTFHFVEKYDRWPWHKFEFFFCAAISLAYIGTSIFATTLGESAGYAVGVSCFNNYYKHEILNGSLLLTQGQNVQDHFCPEFVF